METLTQPQRTVPPTTTTAVAVDEPGAPHAYPFGIHGRYKTLGERAVFVGGYLLHEPSTDRVTGELVDRHGPSTIEGTLDPAAKRLAFTQTYKHKPQEPLEHVLQREYTTAGHWYVNRDHAYPIGQLRIKSMLDERE